MTTVEDAKCLHYISDEDKWKRIHQGGSMKKLPIRDQEIEALYEELKAQKAFAANTAQPNLERARAKASAEDMNENGQAIQQAFKQAIPKLKEGWGWENLQSAELQRNYLKNKLLNFQDGSGELKKEVSATYQLS